MPTNNFLTVLKSLALRSPSGSSKSTFLRKETIGKFNWTKISLYGSIEWHWRILLPPSTHHVLLERISSLLNSFWLFFFNFRYFFKTVCEELNNQVIQEELNKDSDLLPLCEGKVMALAKPIDWSKLNILQRMCQLYRGKSVLKILFYLLNTAIYAPDCLDFIYLIVDAFKNLKFEI